MDYFDFFEIPLSFYPDLSLIRKKYLENSRNSHPDFSTEEDEFKSMELTAYNNKAYTTLNSQPKRINYILHELFPSTEKLSLPPEFLMEMMDTNEELMEAKMMEDNSKIATVKTQINQVRNDLLKQMEEVMNDFDFSDPNKLDGIRTLDLKMNYLNRILTNLA